MSNSPDCRQSGRFFHAVILWLIVSCALITVSSEARAQSTNSKTTPDTRPPSPADVLDLNGKPADPLAAASNGTKATVLIFLNPECPIANRYAPTIQRLARQFEPQGARFWLVYPEAGLAPDKIQQHLKDYGYSLRAVRDPRQFLVRKAKVQVTPEAAVFTGDEKLLYHGRIDNRYADFGKERPEPTERDLQEALEAALAGRKIPRAASKAIGCYIPR